MNKKGRGRNSQNTQQQRVPPQQPRSAPPQRHQPDRGHAAAGGTSGGLRTSQRAANSQQTSVREMISRLDPERSSLSRSVSPSKRPRHHGVFSDASDGSDPPAPLSDTSRPLTEATLLSALQNMADQIKANMSKEFGILKEDIGRLHGRIYELEQHVAERDNYVEELERRISHKDERI